MVLQTLFKAKCSVCTCAKEADVSLLLVGCVGKQTLFLSLYTSRSMQFAIQSTEHYSAYFLPKNKLLMYIASVFTAVKGRSQKDIQFSHVTQERRYYSEASATENIKQRRQAFYSQELNVSITFVSVCLFKYR